MVSVLPKASSGETTRDIDELLTVHEDVLWNENPMSEVKRIQRLGQNSAANLYINDVVFIRPNVRQDLGKESARVECADCLDHDARGLSTGL